MKRMCVIRLGAPGILVAGMFSPALRLRAQTPTPVAEASPATPPVSPSVVRSLLDKAHAFELRGRMDLAEQTWQQVLLADPNNVDALGGLARSAKLSGNTAVSNTYLERLRAVSPNDPNIARVENLAAQQDQNVQLQEASKLAQSGQYAAAMVKYRQVFGTNPPPGDWSLAYYETEAATEDGRPHAIAALRALILKYPSEARYQISLGRILTYDPKTREEGRRFLDRFPKDTQAEEALRQSLLWDSGDPAAAARIRAYLATHRDPQLAQAFAGAKAQSAANAAAASSRPPTAAVLAGRARSAAEVAAYKALAAKNIDDAETRFKAILAKEPENAKALAGMGYVRMEQGNFSGAISFLEQARHDDSTDPGLSAALDTSRFWFIMGEGQMALDANDLTTAEKEYRDALGLRPASPEALAGLGGTLLKAQQPAAAVPLFQAYVQAKPTAADGWRGLFLAQYQAGDAALALGTEAQIPAGARAELMKDPGFLQTLASAYTSAGRDADAQRVLETALNLPFPAGARGLKVETQMQFAGILLASNRLQQAVGLYRQVLAADHANVPAWQGLIRGEHSLNHDGEALQTIESMPPAVYAAAMKDAGFESTVASVYQAQKKLDIAQDLIEKAVAQQAAAGQKASPGIEMQLAGIYLERGDVGRAYPIYQQVLTDNPSRVDAWAGLLSALHVAHRDREAVQQVQLIPAAVRAQLETNIGYLETIASVYAALGESREAAPYLERVKEFYAAQHTAAPAEIEIQNAWLLYNGMNDAGLYRQLMAIGGRTDLTDEQRRTVQTIWTNWAVRRANQASAAGNSRRALAILNAAARSFPDNPQVNRALANGYARAGQPAQAVQIFKSQGMASASVADYQGAVGAAMAAGDNKDAQVWLKEALTAHPSDPQVLILAAKFEQSRGDTTRAIAYYRQSLKEMPQDGSAGRGMASELGIAPPASPLRLPSEDQVQDLSVLLAPGATDLPAGAAGGGLGQVYLPSYGNVAQPQPGSGVVPPYMSNPQPVPPPSQPTGGGRLRDYIPQSRVSHAPGRLSAPAQAEVANAVGYALAGVLGGPLPVRTMQAASSSLVAIAKPAEGSLGSPQTYQSQQIARVAQQAATQAPLRREEVYGPFVPYVAPARPGVGSAPAELAANRGPAPAVVPVQLADTTPHAMPEPAELTDVISPANYLSNTPATNSVSSHPDIAAAQAAEIRRHQSDTETSAAPAQQAPLDVTTVTTHDAQYAVAQSEGGPLVSRPSTAPSGSGAEVPDSSQQQYPQPRAAQGQGATSTRRRIVRASPAPVAAPAAAPPLEAPAQPPQPEPASAAIAPAAPVTYYPPLAVPQSAPSDAELMASNQPPLRGELTGLTPRQDAENQLAALEGSYSGWLGGTGIGRYRSGTSGIDRLYDSEVPFEASTVIGHAVRLTVIPRAVFLNSGTLNTSLFAAYAPNTLPYLGTLPANAANAPAQQLSNGLGGEVQLTTKNIGLAAGYTPYEFLVRNITGHARYRPAGGHFTLYADRDSVKDTQLSYAGLRDPGTITPAYSGTIWGGVISTTGGVRLDFGSGGSGFYISGDGGILRGDHVLSNTKYEGAAGAYFRVKTLPDYGSLTVGAALFGMHYAYNELGLTYGQGGYFSPDDYVLATVPVEFNGFSGTNFHYRVSGAIGVQTFQQDAAPFFPLDSALEGAVQTTLACTLSQLVARTCGAYPVSGITGLNYSLNAEVSYRYREHWYLGGFFSANDTNNYNTVSGGFFFRYVFHAQHTADNFPTGLFPAEGFRALQIP